MVREKEVTIASSTLKPVFIRLQLSAGEAMSVPPLSSTLGQVQINSLDFCKAFNFASLERFESGVLLNIDLFKNQDNTYYFYIRSINTAYILFQTANRKHVPLEILYDAFRTKIISINQRLTFVTSKQLFGSMRGIRFRVIFL